ncbi:hypothetical protein B0T18DRAFT_185789 [Schizothecium vesticola]|uniref:ZZ-type domain-containing protein n=1 Tax=Schizothecium vesticola TaxID=314040 RepID=A0AA40K2K9_9PEZI|nr:hypothetical protein B0T18DRAFT_185789 [Schizothecium vesticola]
MGLHDLFHFNSAAYTLKVSQLPTSDLKLREAQKFRQICMGSGSAVGSCLMTAATSGLSLAFTAFAARNVHVASKKLAIIEAELTRRGVPLREVHTGDAVATFVGGMAAGVVGGEAQAAFGPDMSTVTGAVPLDGSSFQPQPSAGDVLGGMAVAEIAGFASGWAFDRLLQDADLRGLILGSVGCSRLLGVGSTEESQIGCDMCGIMIRGLFAHCCACEDDFDLCLDCYEKRDGNPKCNSTDSEHHMVLRQLVVHGLSDSTKALMDIDRKKRQIHPVCDRCGIVVIQGRIYTCDVCKNGSDAFILCTSCYHSGGTCNHPSTHSLYAFLVASLPETGNVSSYEKEYGSGLISCNSCERQIVQGAYYQCEKEGCRDGPNNFDICHLCYEMGRSCNSSTHTLSQYFTYDLVGGSLHKPYEEPGTFCDCCRKGVQEFYHCEVCKGGRFDICLSCYMTGQGCKNNQHILIKSWST